MLSGRRLRLGNKVEGVLKFDYREKAQPRNIYICVAACLLAVRWERVDWYRGRRYLAEASG